MFQRDFALRISRFVLPIYTNKSLPWTEPQYEMLITYKVGGKWFMLADSDKKFIDVKCDPETIGEMRSRYEGVFPAWHMNKERWLGVKLEPDAPNAMIKRLIKDG